MPSAFLCCFRRVGIAFDWIWPLICTCERTGSLKQTKFKLGSRIRSKNFRSTNKDMNKWVYILICASIVDEYPPLYSIIMQYLLIYLKIPIFPQFLKYILIYAILWSFYTRYVYILGIKWLIVNYIKYLDLNLNITYFDPREHFPSRFSFYPISRFMWKYWCIVIIIWLLNISTNYICLIPRN